MIDCLQELCLSVQRSFAEKTLPREAAAREEQIYCDLEYLWDRTQLSREGGVWLDAGYGSGASTAALRGIQQSLGIKGVTIFATDSGESHQDERQYMRRRLNPWADVVLSQRVEDLVDVYRAQFNLIVGARLPIGCLPKGSFQDRAKLGVKMLMTLRALLRPQGVLLLSDEAGWYELGGLSATFNLLEIFEYSELIVTAPNDQWLILHAGDLENISTLLEHPEELIRAGNRMRLSSRPVIGGWDA